MDSGSALAMLADCASKEYESRRTRVLAQSISFCQRVIACRDPAEVLQLWHDSKVNGTPLASAVMRMLRLKSFGDYCLHKIPSEMLTLFWKVLIFDMAFRKDSIVVSVLSSRICALGWHMPAQLMTRPIYQFTNFGADLTDPKTSIPADSLYHAPIYYLVVPRMGGVIPGGAIKYANAFATEWNKIQTLALREKVWQKVVHDAQAEGFFVRFGENNQIFLSAASWPNLEAMQSGAGRGLIRSAAPERAAGPGSVGRVR